MQKKLRIDPRLLKELNFKLLAVIITLALFGILNIYLCTKGGVFSSPYIFVKKQIMWFIISMVTMYLLLTFDYELIFEYVPVIYWLINLLLVAVWIPGIGATINGERGWINLRVFLLQPSEFAKFSIILMLAKLLVDMKFEINNFQNIRKIILYLAVPMGLILIQKDMGMTMVCFFIALGIVFIAGLDKRIIIGGFISIAVAIVILWNSGLIFEHQKDRITEFMSSDVDVNGSSYQLAQGMIGIGNGGLFGYRLSLDPKDPPGYAGTHVPEVQTDFIFAALAEQWGLVGVAFLLTMYGILINESIKIARTSRDRFGEVICVGTISYFLFAITQNIGMTLRFLPITGITLPLISYGGSSLWTTMIALALILNIGMRRKKLNF